MATTMREIIEWYTARGGLTDEELDAPLVLDTNYTGEGYELEVELYPTALEGAGVAFVCARGNLIYSIAYPEEPEDDNPGVFPTH